MQSKKLTLFFIFIAFFSLQGHSQTKKESNHPLLDKYYPRAEKDTGANVTTAPKPTPQFVQPPVVSPALPSPATPAPIITTTVNAPITTAPLPGQKIASGTMIQDTLVIAKTIPESIPQPETKIVAETIPSSTVTKVAASNTPVSTTTLVPAQKVVQPRPSSTTPYDTRLGSSTQAYDTWKKNNNGAGSVTTSVK